MSPFSPKIIPQNTWLRTVHPLNSKKSQVKLDENLIHQPGHGHHQPQGAPTCAKRISRTSPAWAAPASFSRPLPRPMSWCDTGGHGGPGNHEKRLENADKSWEKSWKNPSLFGGKCEWKTKALAEKMESTQVTSKNGGCIDFLGIQPV